MKNKIYSRNLNSGKILQLFSLKMVRNLQSTLLHYISNFKKLLQPKKLNDSKSLFTDLSSNLVRITENNLTYSSTI